MIITTLKFTPSLSPSPTGGGTEGGDVCVYLLSYFEKMTNPIYGNSQIMNAVRIAAV